MKLQSKATLIRRAMSILFVLYSINLLNVYLATNKFVSSYSSSKIEEDDYNGNDLKLTKISHCPTPCHCYNNASHGKPINEIIVIYCRRQNLNRTPEFVKMKNTDML